MTGKRKRNYLNNRDLLTEIHKSKTTFSEFEKEEFADFDAIIYDIDILTNHELCKEIYEVESFEDYITNVKLARIKRLKRENPDVVLNVEDIMAGDLVFRFMTWDHIPEDPNWPEDKDKKKASDGYVKLNFPPFKHFVLENGAPRVVGYSHWKDGKFNKDDGETTEKLGRMFMVLVEKISKKGSYRNYTYIDEMCSAALLQLSTVGLLFDEGRGQIPNPFAFYTTVVNNVFKRVLNTEKKNRNIRDDLIEMAGQNPSFTRQGDEPLFTSNVVSKKFRSDMNDDPINVRARKYAESKK